MKALVYHGPGQKAWENVPKPTITADTDAIVRVDATTICGTDLHILKGDLPQVTDGRILGHEAVGTVESVGCRRQERRPGDRVLVSCVSSCARCRFCREGRYGQCLGGGGWILGYLIDGTQAEFVRVPFADTSTYPVPDGVSDEDMLMLADILPDELRGRRPQRSRRARRRCRHRRRRPDRSVGDHDRAALQSRAHRRHRPRRQLAWRPPSASAPTWSSTACARIRSTSSGSHRRPRR